MIPVVGFLIFTNNSNKKRLKVLGLWFIPVILIPLIWPLYAAYNGQFHEWLDGVLWQGTERQGIGIRSINFIFNMDPVTLILGLAGAVFVATRKDFFFLLWLIPFFIYTLLVGWVTFFHWLLLLPSFCIASARVIEGMSNIISNKKKVHRLLLSSATITAIGIFGLISTIMLITTNFFLSEFEVAAFVAQNTNKKNNNNNDVTIISGPVYSWIFKYIFGNDHVFSHYRDSSQLVQTKRIISIVDNPYRHIISNVMSKNDVEDKNQIQRLQKIYNNTDTIATFQDNYNPLDYRRYPYINIGDCLFNIEVKANY
jgi:hypothetical protein